MAHSWHRRSRSKDGLIDSLKAILEQNYFTCKFGGWPGSSPSRLGIADHLPHINLEGQITTLVRSFRIEYVPSTLVKPGAHT